MGKPKRVFDKKNSITFRLISQPIQTQETVIQNKVLVVAAKPNQLSNEDAASKLAQLEKEFGGSVTFRDGKAPISIYDPNYQWREDEEVVDVEEFEEDDGEAYDDLDDELDFDDGESVELSDLEKEFGEAEDEEESADDEEEKEVFKGKKTAGNKKELIGVIGKKDVELDDATLERLLTENASKHKSKKEDSINEKHLQQILEQNPNAYMKNAVPLPQDRKETRFFINNDDTNDETIAEDMRKALDGDYESDEFEEFDDDFFAQLNADTLSDTEEGADSKKKKTKKSTQKKDAIPETKEGKIDVGKMLQQEQQQRRRGHKEEDLDEEEEYYDEEEEEEEYIPKQTKRTPFDRVYGEAFEKLLEKYDEDEIGDLEGHTDDDIHGQLEINQISHLINEFIYNNNNINADDILSDDEEYDGVKRPKVEDLLISERFKQLEAELAKEGLRVLTPEEALRRRQEKEGNNITQNELAELILKRLEFQEQKRAQNQGKEDEEEEYEYIKRKPREKWDCQTIVSTYSNLENHPTLIQEPRRIKLSKKSGMPLGVLEPQKTEEEQLHEELEDHDPENIKVNLGEGRAKTETKEEKLLRKKVMQEYKKQKRQLKKSVKEAFKEEEKKQSKLNAMPHTRQRVVLKYE